MMTAARERVRPEDRVCLGAVAGARGLKGEVRIKSFTADPDAIGAYGPVTTEDGRHTFDVRVVSSAKGLVVARLSGIADRDAAEALKGTRLYVARAALPLPDDADTYYHADLIGLGVVTESGEALGAVKAVHDFGAGDVIEIAGATGKETLLLPFTRGTVPVVDTAAGRIVVRPPGTVEAPIGKETGGEAGEETADETDGGKDA